MDDILRKTAITRLIGNPDRRGSEATMNHLASFPQLNPNPIIELDPRGKVVFSNNAALETLKKLDREDLSLFFPHDLKEILKLLSEKSTDIQALTREVFIKDKVFEVNIYLIPELRVLRMYAREITQQRRVEREREITINFMNLINQSAGSQSIVREATTFFQELSGCEAVGIRLKEGDDYPYFEASGFPEEFLRTENSLCARTETGNIVRNANGNPVMECFCGSLICGRFDPSKSFFTEHGSFWTNSTTEWIASANKADMPFGMRNRCNAEGYESVALMRLCVDQGQFGILQLNSTRRGLFSSETINFWERLAAHLSIVLAKVLAEDALKRAHDELEIRVQERTAQVVAQSRILESFFKHTQTSLVFLDKDFNFIRVNEAYARTCAREVSDFSGHNYFLDYPSEELKGKFRQVIGTKEPYAVLERPFVFPDHPEWGVTYWDLHVAPIMSESGNVESLVFSLRDVSDHRKAEVALQESEERYRSIFENSIDGILLTSPDGSILAANPEACRIFGRTEEEICQAGRAGIVDLTSPKTLTFFAERTRTGKARGEIVGIRRDGTQFSCEQSSAIFLDKDGNMRTSMIVRDITERKRTEEELRLQAEMIIRINRLYSMLSKVNEAIVRVHDPEKLYEQVCRIIVENGSFKMAWIGLIDPDTLRVKPIASYGDSDGYLHDITIYAADVPEGRGPTGRAVFEGAYCICADIERDARMLPWRSRALRNGFRSSAAFPIHAGSTIIGALTLYSDKPQPFTHEEIKLLKSLAEDVSFAVEFMVNEEQRRKAEVELKKLNEELERRVSERTAQLEASNDELESFSYSVSHDLRAPLRAIDGFSRKILEQYQDKLDKEGNRFLNIIRKNTKDMGQLIDDLLAFSRIGRQKINKTDIDMGSLAETVYNDLRISVPDRTIKFVMKSPPQVYADKALIRQVLANLLSNAMKFTGPRSDAFVEFGGKGEGEETVYYVKDNGVGFDMRYVEKLFGVFQRLHSVDEFEGTGVGLAIVQRIVLMHGGRIWAEGKVDQGATFYFTLPKETPQPIFPS